MWINIFGWYDLEEFIQIGLGQWIYPALLAIGMFYYSLKTLFKVL